MPHALGLEVWTLSVPLPKLASELAARAESSGFDGIAFTDSQNLTGDVFAGLALAAKATSRIGLATGVTNPVTRHPAATLFQIGLEPAPLASFELFLSQLATYLRGGEVDLDGYASRLRWLAGLKLPPVPIDVAATGPRVIEIAARFADRITFAVGANPERLRWGIQKARAARAAAGLDPESLRFGAYVNVAPHPDVAVARELVRGGVGTFAHFSGMRGSSADGVAREDRAVFEGIHGRYEREKHTLGRARHAAALDDAFLDRFAVVGPTQACVARLQELVEVGASKLIVTGASFDADRSEAGHSRALFERDVLPALKGR
jgi:5,10-methylenetetrahydromethanopterin reductase